MERLVGQLQYYQYRDELSNQAPSERWHDCGLGNTWRDIADTCRATATTDLQPGKNVAARTFVINPHPLAMQMVPQDQRMDILEELTERTITHWYARLHINNPEFSYVIHQANATRERLSTENERERGKGVYTQPREQEPQEPGNHWHAHVVTAATAPNVFVPGRTRYVVDQHAIKELHEAGREEMETIWEREFGEERVQDLNQLLQKEQEYWQGIDQQRAEERRRDLEGIAHRIPQPEVQERDHTLELPVEHEPDGLAHTAERQATTMTLDEPQSPDLETTFNTQTDVTTTPSQAQLPDLTDDDDGLDL